MKKVAALGFSTLTYFGFVLPAFAAELNVNPCPDNNNTNLDFFKLCDLSITNSNVISRVITLALIIAALIALGFLIYGGIRWILSGGEKEKVEEARGTIIAALVGLVIVFAAYFIINIVFGLFGIGNIGDLNKAPALDIFAN
jgi:hypothetical protein